MRLNLVGAFIRNAPFGTEIAFAKGLSRLGVHTNLIDPDRRDQKFVDADATIIFKYVENYLAEIAGLKGPKILYQPDDIRFSHVTEMMTEMRRFCDYAFTFNDDNAARAATLGYKATKILLTADETLYRPILSLPKTIDVCFVGSMSSGEHHKSRRRMAEIVSSMPGVKSVFTSMHDIGRIVELYNRSKIVLHHATDVGQKFGHGYGLQCRHFEAGFTRSCVLSNSIDDDETLDTGICTFWDEPMLKQQIDALLSCSRSREEIAERLYTDLIASHRPEHRAQQIIDFIEGIS
jgi:hypothetical protein